MNNKANQGGAIIALDESTIIAVYGQIAIFNNMAMNNSGSGIYLHQSSIKISGICIVSNNYAEMGGGILAVTSVINVYQPGSLRIINSTADVGVVVYVQKMVHIVKR